MAPRRSKEGRRVRLNARDIPEIVAAHPDMDDEVHSALSVDTAKVETPTDLYLSGPLRCLPGSRDLNRCKIIAGRTLNHADNSEKRRSLSCWRNGMPSSCLASADNAVGQTVKSMGLAWNVVGVFQHDWDRDNYVPFNTLMQIANNGDG